MSSPRDSAAGGLANSSEVPLSTALHLAGQLCPHHQVLMRVHCTVHHFSCRWHSQAFLVPNGLDGKWGLLGRPMMPVNYPQGDSGFQGQLLGKKKGIELLQ